MVIVLSSIPLAGAGVKMTPTSPLQIAEALQVEGWQLAVGKAAGSTAGKSASCGALILFFDSSACSSSQNAKHNQDKSSCREVQQQAVKAISKVDAQYGKQARGILMLGAIDSAMRNKEGKPRSGMGTEFAVALGIADNLREDGAPQLWFFKPADRRMQIGHVESDPVPSMGALLDDTDSSRQRIYSRLFMQGRRLHVEEIVSKVLASAKDAFKEAIMTVANMKCGLREWTDSQIATIQLMQSLSSISKQEAELLMNQGAQLAPYDILGQETSAEVHIKDGQCTDLKHLFDLGLTPDTKLLHLAIRRSSCLATVLNAGVEVNALFKGETALIVAVKNWEVGRDMAIKMIPVVRKLLKLGADPHILDGAGQSVYHIACRSHSYEILELLLNKYPPRLPTASDDDGKSFVLSADNNGQTMLHLAVGHYRHLVGLTKHGLSFMVGAWHYLNGWESSCADDYNHALRQLREGGQDYTPKAVVSGTQAKCGFNAVIVNLVLQFVRSAARKMAPQCSADGAQCRQRSIDVEASDLTEELLEREVWREDKHGWTPVHIAAMHDSADAVKELLSATKRANVLLRQATAGVRSATNRSEGGVQRIGLTPAQVAAISGSKETLSMLLAAEAIEEVSSNSIAKPDVTETSIRHATPVDLAHRFDDTPPPPGQSAHNAMADAWATDSGWRQASDEGKAGKELKRLRSYGCDSRIDVRSNLTWDEFRERYLFLGRPVMITDPLAAGSIMAPFARWRRSSLIAHYGSRQVTVGDVPYPSEFGHTENQSTIAEYLSTSMSGNAKVWKPGDVPSYIFDRVAGFERDIYTGTATRNMTTPHRGWHSDKAPFSFLHGGAVKFTSFQWYLGPTGSGAPVHFHGDAFNYIIYGKKHWFLIPPNHTIYSRKPIGRWIKEDLPRLKKGGTPVLQCVQNAGTVMLVPRLWGHGVLNLQETVGFANEINWYDVSDGGEEA